MIESRKSKRYRTIAKARIPELFGEEVWLKDISVTGCCVEATMFVDVQQNKPYAIEIAPESASGVENFEITAEIRWSRASGDSYEVGFLVTASPKGKQFQRYVDYLSWRESAV
jgi:hypothetical protein